MKKKLTKADVKEIKNIIGVENFILFAFDFKKSNMMGRFEKVGVSEKLAATKELLSYLKK